MVPVSSLEGGGEQDDTDEDGLYELVLTKGFETAAQLWDPPFLGSTNALRSVRARFCLLRLCNPS
jgi:hypothetical protein